MKMLRCSLFLVTLSLPPLKLSLIYGEGKLTLKMGNEKVIFKILDAMHHTVKHDDTCFMIDIINPYVSSHVQEFVNNDPLFLALEPDN